MPTNVNNEEFRLKAVDEVTPVVNQVKRSFSELNAGLDTVKNALGAVGVTVGAGAMVKLYADVVHATAALDDMAESTGASVETLSKLEQVAKIGGHEFDGLTGQISKMVKGLAAQDEEGKKAGKALSALGVSAKDANGMFRDTGEILVDVARKLGQYEDNGNKVALVQDLLGKGAERYLPFLKDIAEEGELNAKVTAQQAAEAEKLEKNINRLKIAFDETKRSLAMELTPAMVDFTEKLLAATKAAGGNIGGGLLTMATAQTRDVRGRITEIDRELAAGEAFRKAAPISSQLEMGKYGSLQTGRMIAEREYLLALERQQVLARTGPGQLDARDLMAQGKSALNYQSPPTSTKKATGPTLSDLLNQSSGVDKDFTRDLEILHKGYEAGKVSLEQYQVAVVSLIEKQEFARKLAQQQDQTNKALLASEEALAKVREKQRSTLADLEQYQRDAVKKAEMEADAVGKTAAQIEKANALREADIALRKALADLSTEDISVQGQLTAELIAQNEAIKERIAKAYDLKASKEAAIEATKKQQEEQKRIADNVERSLTDAIVDGLMGGFQRGESIVDNFIRRLKEAFKTAILEPLIRPIVAPISGFMSGVGQNLAGAFGFGGGGGGGFPSPTSFMNFNGGGIGNFIGGLGDGAVGNFLGGITGGAGLSGTLLADSIMAEMVGGAAVGASGAAIGAGAMSVLGPIGIGAGLLMSSGILDDIFGGGGGDHNDPRWDPKAIERFDPRYGGTPTPAPDWFDSEGYLTANPDIKQLYGFNPYDHYIAWGQNEGRKLQPDNWPEVLAQRAAAKAAEEAARKQEEVARQLEALVDQEERLNDQLTGMVRSLPGQLGITSIQEAMNDLSTSEYRSPLERLNAAQDIFASTLASARAGNLDSVNALPGTVQSLLGIGRDAYASGPQFQSLFTEANRALGEILNQQQALQNDILKDVPATIMQASVDQVGELRKGFNSVVASLNSVQTEIARLRAA